MNNDDFLSIQVTHVDGVAVVELCGEIDRLTAPRLQESVGRLCELDMPVVLDMGQVRFMDSSGISALIVASGMANGLPTPVQIRRPSDQVRKVLALTGLDKLFLPDP